MVVEQLHVLVVLIMHNKQRIQMRAMEIFQLSILAKERNLGGLWHHKEVLEKMEKMEKRKIIQRECKYPLQSYSGTYSVSSA